MRTARTLPMLRALADNPEGLPTPALRALCGGSPEACFSLLQIQERYGRVVRAGTDRSRSGRKAHVWRITSEGRQFINGADPPMTELCLWTLLLLGGIASTTQVRMALKDDGIELTPVQVRTSLWGLAYKEPPLAELVQPGRAGHGTAGVWQLTEAGNAWLVQELGEDSDESGTSARLRSGLTF